MPEQQTAKWMTVLNLFFVLPHAMHEKTVQSPLQVTIHKVILPNFSPSRISGLTCRPSTQWKMCIPCIFFHIKSSFLKNQIDGAKKYSKLSLFFSFAMKSLKKSYFFQWLGKEMHFTIRSVAVNFWSKKFLIDCEKFPVTLLHACLPHLAHTILNLSLPKKWTFKFISQICLSW